MAVKFEKVTNVSLSGKGILSGVTENGFEITDEKEGTVDIITLADIKTLLLGKSVNMKFTTKEDGNE
jgi:hypothetical protein